MSQLCHMESLSEENGSNNKTFALLFQIIMALVMKNAVGKMMGLWKP